MVAGIQMTFRFELDLMLAAVPGNEFYLVLFSDHQCLLAVTSTRFKFGPNFLPHIFLPVPAFRIGV